MKKLICSPHAKLQSENFTCFTNDKLYMLRDKWNERHLNNKIMTNEPREIWSALNTHMSNDLCKHEKCWVRKLVHDLQLQHNILDDTFAPKKPHSWIKKPRTWLSDLDISNVMKQYEDAYPHFTFIGPSPIDFHVVDTVKNTGEYVWPELHNFSLDKHIGSNTTHIGIVFNLDKHTEGGSHWVSLFINLIEDRIYYFDSNGNSTPTNVKKLVDKIKEQGLVLGKKFTLSTNYSNRHQQKNSECGIYVIYFMIQMLVYNNWDKFKHGKIKDDEIFEYRDKYFNDV